MSVDHAKDWLKVPANIISQLPLNIVLDELLSDEGGQGIVYRGKALNIPAAIKIYLPGQMETRVRRETEALKQLNCPSIVNLLWEGKISFQEQDLPVVATKLIPGDSLHKYLHNQELSNDELGILAYDITAAIEAMWEKRIVHRDLKPENVLIKPDGRACVIDLGVARHLDQTSLTALGATWGTFGYMSPEQTRGARQLTCKSDLFALGIILVESALRHHPTQRDQLRLFAKKLHEQLPEEIKNWEHHDILQRLFEPQPIKRPSPAIILEKLKKYQPL
jgi:eukaryotic-like serine/threonine-protein kinase